MVHNSFMACSRQAVVIQLVMTEEGKHCHANYDKFAWEEVKQAWCQITREVNSSIHFHNCQCDQIILWILFMKQLCHLHCVSHHLYQSWNISTLSKIPSNHPGVNPMGAENFTDPYHFFTFFPDSPCSILLRSNTPASLHSWTLGKNRKNPGWFWT